MNTHLMDSDAKKIGDALDAAMNAYNGGRGIKQTSLSRLSGVPQGTISRTLSGKSIPETKTLSKLAAALGSDTFSNTLAAILPSAGFFRPRFGDGNILRKIIHSRIALSIHSRIVQCIATKHRSQPTEGMK